MKMKKRVLMVANQFPPMGGSGVQRSVKFAKYLPEYEWEPVVFTRESSKGLIDKSLLNDIPKDLEVIRTKPYDLNELKKPFNLAGKFISRKLLIPDGDVIWYKKNKDILLDYVKKNNIDIIYTTSYPYSDHLLGLYVKKHMPNIPWVVDFRDEWCNNPYILDMGYSKNRMEKERKMEREVISNCDYFITNTPLMLKNFLKDYDMKEKSFVIPNGYDKDDFDNINKDYVKKDKLIITYSGSMYGRRKPDYFLQAVEELIDEQKIDKKDILIRFIGNIPNKKIKEINENYSLSETVKYLPYMEHKKSIEKLVESDILLFIIGEGKGAENFYSGKVFEYMNTNRPILALVPPKGVAADVIKDTNTGYISDTTNVKQIKELMLKLYFDWKNDAIEMNPNWDKIKTFERRQLTKQLVEILNRAK
ncbi:glycosyl transferase family 1 [Vallitalea longa]|uniref:Glycosyl transferase family 1 n=1 Tax=Vallitalea longa TaxID=2936439 RepID=A0A9W5YEF5_9FIRM|nr:glycosyltransferase [Vallitalea longa]GKX30444.1 glycosyl transferase family 1 [Vallitalea longa]